MQCMHCLHGSFAPGAQVPVTIQDNVAWETDVLAPQVEV